MADVHEPETRSYNMSQIKGKNTKPEMMVRKFLHANGFRYRLHNKNLPGKPDLTLKKYNTVIFVHGCFWHGHEGCKYFVIPKSKTQWWKNKIYGNKKKDLENISLLEKEGWNVIVIWECELKNDKKEQTLNILISKIKQT